MNDYKNILERNKTFYLFLKSKIDFEATQFIPAEKNIAWIEKMGRFAWRNHPGCFYDAEIETLLLQYGLGLDSFVDGKEISREVDKIFPACSENTTLHIATEIANSGGHTRVINQIIKRSKESDQCFILTTGKLSCVPDWFKGGVDPYAKIFSLSKYKSLFEKAFALRTISKRFKRIIVYHHPFDVIPALAFATKGDVPVVVDNHAHSWFWFGISIADLVLCHTEYHTGFTKVYRKAENCFYLPFTQIDNSDSLPAGSEKKQAREFLNIDSDKTVILTVATREKFIPNSEYNFFNVVDTILQGYPNVVFIVVGLSADDTLARAVEKSERLFFFKQITDLTKHYLASDICLEAMPQPSIGVQTQAPVIGLSCPIPGWGKSKVFKNHFLEKSQLYSKHFGKEMSESEFYEKLDLFIKEPHLRLATAEEIRANYLKTMSDRLLHDKLKETYKNIDLLAHTPKIPKETVFFEDADNIEIAERSEFQTLPQLTEHWNKELTNVELSRLCNTNTTGASGTAGMTEKKMNPSVESANKDFTKPSGSSADVRLIAFYLPQYHPIPENDKAWGKGFTEWTNVAKAKPLFPGHDQPHLPSELGYYDLRLDEVRKAQIDLAKEYGLHGFCYYHYWFNGKHVLETPINKLLANKTLDFPFCICWANENWTRQWDGHDDDIILRQDHNAQDDLAFIRSLIPYFKDERYIRIHNKPVLLVYRTELFPDIITTSRIWRDEMLRAGVGELYLVRVESLVQNIDPKDIGFDAALEFAPDWKQKGEPLDVGVRIKHVAEYRSLMNNMLAKPKPGYLRYRCVTPMWDSSARKGTDGTIFANSNPKEYQRWLSGTIDFTRKNFTADEQIVFINAWNEWGEGNHLEPDLKNGRAYLEATKQAVSGSPREPFAVEKESGSKNTKIKRVALVMCPVWNVEHPPLATAAISGQLKSKGYDVRCHDFSIELCQWIKKNDQAFFEEVHMTGRWLRDFESWKDKLSLDKWIEQWAVQILKDKPDLVGFTIYDYTRDTSLLLARAVKKQSPDTLVVFGGPSCSNKELIRKGPVDFMVFGEGEETVTELVKRLNAGESIEDCCGLVYQKDGYVFQTPPRELIPDLDAVPFPDFGGFDLNRYPARMLPMFTSRGCINQCSFCSEKNRWGKYRTRSAGNIVQEFEQHIKKYKIDHFDIVDSIINGKLGEFEKMCDLILEKKINVTWGGKTRINAKMDFPYLQKAYQAGCRLMLFGIESGSQKVLNDMQKNIHLSDIETIFHNCYAVGIKVGAFFITGYVTEEEEHFQETLDFIKRNTKAIDSVHWGSLSILENSPLHEHPEKYGLVLAEHSPDKQWRSVDGGNTEDVRKDRKKRFDAFIANLYPKPDPPPAKPKSRNPSFPRVSVVVSTVDNLKSTSRCLTSILCNTGYPDFEVIVVDNGSKDGTKEYLMNASDPRIKAIYLSSHGNTVLGFNAGARLADGSFLVFMDANTTVSPGWLNALVNVTRNKAGSVSASPKIISSEKRIVEAGFSKLTHGSLIGDGNGLSISSPELNYVKECESGSTHCLLVDRKAFDAVGGFDAAYSSMECAFFDIGIALREKGVPSMYQPLSTVTLCDSPEPDSTSHQSLDPAPKWIEKSRPVCLEEIKPDRSRRDDREKVLVLGVYFSDKTSNIRDTVQIISKTSDYEVVQKWVSLGGAPIPEDLEGVTVRAIPGKVPKFQIMNDVLACENRALYRYVLMVDDDVVLPDHFLDRFLAMQSRLGFALAQPARTNTSFIDHPIVGQQRGVVARETFFVEIGPVVSFENKIYDVVFPFDLVSPMGWGYSNVWASLMRQKHMKMGIIDSVPVDHSLRKPVENYNWNEADRQRSELLNLRKHMPLSECAKVIRSIHAGEMIHG